MTWGQSLTRAASGLSAGCTPGGVSSRPRQGPGPGQTKVHKPADHPGSPSTLTAYSLCPCPGPPSLTLCHSVPAPKNSGLASHLSPSGRGTPLAASAAHRWGTDLTAGVTADVSGDPGAATCTGAGTGGGTRSVSTDAICKGQHSTEAADEAGQAAPSESRFLSTLTEHEPGSKGEYYPQSERAHHPESTRAHYPQGQRAYHPESGSFPGEDTLLSYAPHITSGRFAEAPLSPAQALDFPTGASASCEPPSVLQKTPVPLLTEADEAPSSSGATQQAPASAQRTPASAQQAPASARRTRSSAQPAPARQVPATVQKAPAPALSAAAAAGGAGGAGGTAGPLALALPSTEATVEGAPGAPLLPAGVTVDCFLVEQCSGLSGQVSISGAKNSALAVLAGAICSSQQLVLRRIPDLHDIRRMVQVLESIGVRVERGVDGLSDSVLVDATALTSVRPCPDVVRTLRASFFVIGALAGRQGEAIVPLPGGCNIGARPIDLHVRGLEALGARVEISQGKVHVRALRADRRLSGGQFSLDFPSVGATETLMMAAALADGETVLSNVAQEPEVVDLADFLISCGAHIRGAGTNTLYIKGVRRLGPTEFTIIPDRIETGTFLVAAAVTRSAISLAPVVPRHLTAVICKLREMGCRVQQTQIETISIFPGSRDLMASDVTTLPYPGFPTDLQPQFMTLLTMCRGQSVVTETVFESRMRHVEELQKMGALIRVSGSTAVVSGVDEGSQLYGAPVAATDLRAGAALVIAGMAGGGTTHIEGVGHIDRGYERLDEKLRGLGAKVARLPCLPAELRL